MSVGSSSLIASMLVAAVRQTPPVPVDWAGVDPDLVLRSSVEHRCAPALYLWLRGQDGVPRQLLDPLRATHRDQMLRHMRRLAELSRVARALDAADISWVVVKGPVLSERLWPRSDMRQYADLDVVVDRRQLGEALDALEEGGATLVDRNWPMIRSTMRGELTLRLPHGTALDLHWHLVNERGERRMFDFPVEEMLARRVPAGLEGLQVDTLDPVDTVLHLAYHTARSGGQRLCGSRTSRRRAAPGVSWDVLQERAARYGCALVLEVVARRCEAVLGPLPGRRPSPHHVAWTHKTTGWTASDRCLTPGCPTAGRMAFRLPRHDRPHGRCARLPRCAPEPPGTSLTPTHSTRCTTMAQPTRHTSTPCADPARVGPDTWTRTARQMAALADGDGGPGRVSPGGRQGGGLHQVHEFPRPGRRHRRENSPTRPEGASRRPGVRTCSMPRRRRPCGQTIPRADPVHPVGEGLDRSYRRRHEAQRTHAERIVHGDSESVDVVAHHNSVPAGYAEDPGVDELGNRRSPQKPDRTRTTRSRRPG